MFRTARAAINLAAARHNVRRVKTLASGNPVMAVVKADAYGHGQLRIAQALVNEVDGFAVACVTEALALHEMGIRKPVTVLQGFHNEEELLQCAQHGFRPVVHDEAQLRMAELAKPAGQIHYWLKVDTGMGRLGFMPDQAASAMSRLLALASCQGQPGLLSHLADADNADSRQTHEQLDCYAPLKSLATEYSLANSAAILQWPQTHVGWVRPGLMLYGASPMDGGTAAEHDLRPVMTLTTKIISVRHLPKGTCVGYACTWRAPEDTIIAILAIGYGDGYSRHARIGTPVLINGMEMPVVGRVSMDMLAVELKAPNLAKVGDDAVLWGDGLPIERVAEAAGTIPYELMCSVSGQVSRVYVEEQ